MPESFLLSWPECGRTATFEAVQFSSEAEISFLQLVRLTDANDSWFGLNLLERRLVDPHATVEVPLDDRVLFVSSLHGAEFPIRLSEVAQTLYAISGTQFLAGGGGLGERWSLGPVGVQGSPPRVTGV